jgi:AAA+ superfamily predicted ATPase
MFPDERVRGSPGNQKLKPAVFYGLAGTGKSTMARTLAILNGYRPFVINASEERSVKTLMKKILNQLEYDTTFKHCPVCDVEEYKKAGKFYGVSSNEVSARFHECLKKPPLVILDEVDGIAMTNNETLVDKLLDKLYLANPKVCLFPLYDKPLNMNDLVPVTR